jgi:hypothetical protein
VQREHERKPAADDGHRRVRVQRLPGGKAGRRLEMGPQLDAAALAAQPRQREHHQRQRNDEQCRAVRAGKLKLVLLMVLFICSCCF